ncbi:MAG TPA: type II secretion system protein GspM [Solirubrobacteraceae bacterium]
MTTRDRLMLIGILALAALAGAWFTTVAPEREKAAKISAEVETARTQLASAESAADSAKNAQAQYSSAYASLVSLGQAVPASAETPGLIYTLDKATHSRNVNFTSITSGTSGAPSSAASATAATAATQNTAFSQEPFTFVFNGSFVDLYKLLDQLEGFTVQTSKGALHVNGRLLTIDSVSLAPSSTGSSAASSKSKSPRLTGTISATAYVLPAGATPLGGATPASPAGGATTAGSTSSSGSAVTPAVVKATP